MISMLLQLVVMIGAIALGSRKGGVGMGLWGAVGVFVLATVFDVAPADTSGIVDVMLIILAVIMAAAAMEAAGGIEYLVGVAEKAIRRNPSRVTFIAPVVSWLFTLGAGTAHVFYPLLPVIHDVAREGGVRPERPIAVSSIAATVGITASPVSAAMAAMIVLYDKDGWGLPKIMAVAVPATLLGVLVAALVQSRIGKPLDQDPEYQRRLAAGEIEPVAAEGTQAEAKPLKPRARWSAYLFLAGTVAVVVSGLFPDLRPEVPGAKGSAPLSMPATIEILMMAVAALILLVCKVDAKKIPGSEVARSGLVAVIGVFGLSWLGLSFIGANEKRITDALGGIAESQPWFFAVMLLLLSSLLFSQATTTKALMPLGVALGIPTPLLIAMWPAVNGYFILPTYGTYIAAINFDRTGTTKVGRFVVNHSFMIPGLVTVTTAVLAGFGIAELLA
ncbi:anaerobic C4-dicarboxylate transporter family protein [Streptomyces sp. NBC_01304]|uniref:anaerobic C4-dicarboxylate transporter family protein n=1 Tax=Streptomyces sp. NBC_01304 TaxID=2903818 RepID=UPI002E0D9C5D|nr:anaerobic C4-dicarboxylate transporter family protein [Streptomyces sp. NBC_01304]